MARSLKTRGMTELNSLRSRVRRQRTLHRITSEDAGKLEELLAEMEARIISMRETNEHGEEEW